MVSIDEVKSCADEASACLKHLHRHPELGFEEHETAKFIAERLASYGVKGIRTGVGGGTGVIADIDGSAGQGKTIMLRADIDALPLTEASGVEYASESAGKMHACGHDSHVSMLLGAAKWLSEHREAFKGRVRLCFQPAEEGPAPGGAALMIEDGVMDGVDACLAAHVTPTYPVGTIMVQAKESMASADKFIVTIKGYGGHGAMPHLAVDPIPALSEFLAAANLLPARELDPLDPCVVTIGTVNTISSSWNVVPGSVEITGTFRAMTHEVRDMIGRRISEMARDIAAAHRCVAEYVLDKRYAPTINDEGMVKFVLETAGALLGKDNAVLFPRPFMTAEDAGAYFRVKPGALIWIGCTAKSDMGAGKTVPNLHNPAFKVAPGTLPVGIALHVNNALSYLK
ncbi:MAG: amidohydrolase [Synergistaceae bacterium]|jgi:amidohydrolase|nr:amidohydrolase [Synergistaceae bacterium]